MPTAAYAVPTSSAAMSLSPGLYLPPPPPRSPGSAGSGSFPQNRRVPPAQPPSIQTTWGGAGPGHRQGTGVGVGSPYPYSPAVSYTPLSPYASAAPTTLSQDNSRANSPMALRGPSGNTMVAEYNPQQWQRGGQSGIQFRPFTATTVNVASRAVDDNGGKRALFISDSRVERQSGQPVVYIAFAISFLLSTPS